MYALSGNYNAHTILYNKYTVLYIPDFLYLLYLHLYLYRMRILSDICITYLRLHNKNLKHDTITQHPSTILYRDALKFLIFPIRIKNNIPIQ